MRREALVATHQKLDPVIGGILREDIARNGLSHILSTMALVWCGLWVAQVWSVFLLPLFATSIVEAFRRRMLLFLLYAGSALTMAANHYPRYNLTLIGPISVGLAWIICRVWTRPRHRIGMSE